MLCLIGFQDGVGSSALFNHPVGIASDPNNFDILYVADFGNGAIRKILINTQAVTSPFVYNSIPNVYDLVIDSHGINIYASALSDHVIYKIQINVWSKTIYTGSLSQSVIIDGDISIARFIAPGGLAIDPFDNIYIADMGGNNIRKISTIGFNVTVTTLAGNSIAGLTDGISYISQFNGSTDLVSNGLISYVIDHGNQAIRSIQCSVGSFFYDNVCVNTPTFSPTIQSIKYISNIVVTTFLGNIVNSAFRHDDDMNQGDQLNLGFLFGLCFDSTETYLYIVTKLNVHKINIQNITSTSIENVTFNSLQYCNSDLYNNTYFTDFKTIYHMNESNIIHSIVGSTKGDSDGYGLSALIDTPTGIVINPNNNHYIYFGDSKTNKLKFINHTSNDLYRVTTLLNISGLQDLIIDTTGTYIYGTTIYESNSNSNIIQIIMNSWIVRLFAGTFPLNIVLKYI